MEKYKIALSNIGKDLAGMFEEKMTEGIARKHLSISRELAAVFGEKMAADALRMHITELNIDLKNPTRKDLEKLIDTIEENVFRRFVGPEKARAFSKKYRALLG